MDGETIRVFGQEYTVEIVQKNYIANEGWPAMRCQFTINDETSTIVLQGNHLLQNLAAAVEDIVFSRIGSLAPIVD